ncbi:MAG: AarF/ABC1/UbiB kinase family protein [Actinobacteria bacterium]|nr:MAG: AarF/ABC1/UbiB kinase family protein [Actinomycetota bacterium]
MGARTQRLRRGLEVTRVARRSGLRRVLREVGVAGERPATREGAVEFRLGLEELGTTYVKLGQLLSSRPDLLPDVYIDELSKLVDDAPPVPFEQIEETIVADLGADVFARIDAEPLASASIAQVHGALLEDGREVVVKVRRPGVMEQVDVDLDLMRSTVRFLHRHSEKAQLLQLEALADELEVHLRGELDLSEEAHNTELVGAAIADFPTLFVAQVIRPHVTERVLVLERVHGEKVGRGHGLAQDQARRLARDFFRAYIRQVTLAGVYHADPHRGNVSLTNDGRLALLDHGLLGRLDDETRTTLSLLLLAIAGNRTDDVGALLLSLSLTTLDSNEPAFLHELHRKLPRYHWRPLAEISTGEALADLQRIALRHEIRLPTSFALIGKTLSQADSIARLLDPELDPIALIEQESLRLIFAEAEERLEPDRFFGTLLTQLASLSRLPRRVAEVAERLEAGTLKVGVVPTDLEGTEHMLRSVANRVGASLIVVGLLIASALMARVSHAVALAGFCLSGLLGLYMVWRIIRTPGEL